MAVPPSQYSNWSLGIGDSDDEDEPADEYHNSRTTVLFMIEATDTMLSPILGEDTASPPAATQAAAAWKGQAARSKMEIVLRAAYAMMKRKVISAPKDSVGILIYNTAASQSIGESNLRNAQLLTDLAPPTALSIQALKALLQASEEDPNHLSTLFAPNKGQNITQDTFGHANTVIRARDPRKSNKSILLVTDNDDPVEDAVRHVAFNKRKDLQDMNYTLHPFFIPPTPSSTFDLTKFWGPVITMSEDSDLDLEDDAPPYPTVNEDLTVALNLMVSSLRTKDAVKRSSFMVPFVLGEGFVLGINGYMLIGEEKKKLPVKVDLNTEAGEEVVSKTIYKDAQSGESLDPKKEIKKYFSVGGTDIQKEVYATKIFFDEAEIRKIKSIGRSPALRLIGFKPRKEYLRFHETIKHSYFIYPNEETYSGSTRTFAALLDTMVEKDKIGFGSLLMRVGGRPQMVVMIPQQEALDANGMQMTPPGIHLCQLPFADDVRPVGIETRASIIPTPDSDADDDEYVEIPAVEAAKKIIKRLTKKSGYNPETYLNPALNYHYNTLAAIALDEEPGPPEDATIPPYGRIEANAGKQIRALKELIKEDEMDFSNVVTSNKRRIADVDPSAPLPDASEWIADFKSRGTKMLVADLKKGLKLLGESTTGVKADLFQRVKDALVKRGEALDDDEDGVPPPKKRKKKSKSVGTEEESNDEEAERRKRKEEKRKRKKERRERDSMDEDD
ncbi:ATP-dependent DNA helicase 2 subunit 1, partial [Phenoliferia sp. Uapishka_3]